MTCNEYCLESLQSLPAEFRRCVLTIGNFDGMHLGHQRILETACRLARQEGLKVVAMTFEPPPDLVLRPADSPQRLAPPQQKRRLLEEAGADHVVIVRSDQTFLSTGPEEFIREVLLRRFAPRHIVEGPNFFFGRGRSGDIQTLRDAAVAGGFEVHVVDPILLEVGGRPQRVSSTLIRQLVAAGNVEDAARCLGRPFTLYGTIVAGQGQGRILEFPTANIQPGQQIVPPDGVYAGQAVIEDSTYPAAISVGTKPTLGPAPRTIEAFLLDATGDFYGRAMALRFLHRLRDQRRFDDIDSLKTQIAKDVKRVRELGH